MGVASELCDQHKQRGHRVGQLLEGRTLPRPSLSSSPQAVHPFWYFSRLVCVKEGQMALNG